MSLLESGENYLEEILILTKRNGSVRSIDIAKHLKVSRPAVTKALKHLSRLGYVSKSTYEDVSFTPKGRAFAKNIYHRHKTIKKFLISIGVNEKTAEIDCCKIEHVISNETLEALTKLIKD